MNLEVTTEENSQVIPIFKFKKKSRKDVHANSYTHRGTRGVGVDGTRPWNF